MTRTPISNIKVLVVDDSAFMRRVISDIINKASGMEVIGTARDGTDAIGKIKVLKPDVVTMDIEMPKMDGLAALQRIMRDHPLPVIMLSSLTQNGAQQTMRALNLGAVDFIPKPSGQISLDIDMIKEDIVRKIKIAAGTSIKLQNIYNIRPIDEIFSRDHTKVLDYSKPLSKLVLIGTSTGGPKALHQVIPAFPASVDAGILVVQHMPPGFTRSLAERLDSISPIKVKEAEHGEKVVPGCAYIAPGDYHLTVRSQGKQGRKELHICLDKTEPVGGHRPSVDRMLQSAAEQFWAKLIGVIMTGMGRDGAAGLTQIKDKGGATIAEHQSSCIVYGMPKAAINTGKVDKVVPLSQIGSEIIRML